MFMKTTMPKPGGETMISGFHQPYGERVCAFSTASVICRQQPLTIKPREISRKKRLTRVGLEPTTSGLRGLLFCFLILFISIIYDVEKNCVCHICAMARINLG